MDSHQGHDMGGHAGHEGMGINCEGEVLSGEGGSYIGHVGPGALFVIWGSWWAYNACLRSVWSRANQTPFKSASFYRMPGKAALIEPVLKIVLPVVALSMELYLDHLQEGFQYMYCPKSTKNAGQFAGDNINNWQHASSYPAVITSGVVDLISTVVELPKGTTNAFSALVFGVMGFLMSVHEKHEALDKMVHWLLSVAMLMACAFILMEMYAPKSPVISMGKAASNIFVGAWLIFIGRVMFLDFPAWTQSKGLASMMAPVFFSMIFLLICVCILVLYMILAVLHKRHLIPVYLMPPLPSKHADLSQPAGKRALELAERRHLLSQMSFDNDSALCSSDGTPDV